MFCDAKSFIFGVFTGIFVICLWQIITAKKSHFDSGIFANATTSVQAQQIFEQSSLETKNKYNALIKDAQASGRDGKDIMKEAGRAIQDVTTAYNEWSIDHPAPPPSPQSVPAPSPTM